MKHTERTSSAAAPMTGSLSSLVAPFSARAFLARHWQTRPLFVRGAPSRLAAIARDLDFSDVASLLRHQAPPRVQVWMTGVDGRFIAVETASSEALEHWRAGQTIYAHLDESVPSLRRWQVDVARDLGVVPSGHVSVFLARRSAGTRWHFDANDNFTVQLAGTKRWHLAPGAFPCPTTNFMPSLPPSGELLLQAGAPPTVPTRAARSVTLRPGSMLYVPPGYWHATEATDESISLNFMYSPRCWADVFTTALKHALVRDPEWRKAALGLRGDLTARRSARAALVRCANALADDALANLAEDLVPIVPDARPIRSTTRLRRNRLAVIAPDEKKSRGPVRVVISFPMIPFERYALEVPRHAMPALEWIAARDEPFRATEVGGRARRSDVERLLDALVRAGAVHRLA